MSVVITQSPTFPNGTQSDILYVVSSSLWENPQFKYVCEIQSEGGTVLSQIKQASNSNGYGVFEIGRLLDDHMGYDSPWLIDSSVPMVTSSNENITSFGIKFTEEYGTSISSSITTGTYVSASIPSITTFIPSVTERDSGNFNWDSGSYDALTNAPNVSTTLNYNSQLNAQVVSNLDYLTLSTLNGIARKGDLISVTYYVYNTNKTLVYNTTVSNPHTAAGTLSQLVHIGVGPQNLQNVGDLSIYFQNPLTYPCYGVALNYTDGSSDYHYYKFNCLYYDGANFAFTNKLGMFDYYRATLVGTESETFNRKTYDAPYINYSTDTPVIDFNYARRGKTQFLNTFSNNYTAETDWLTQGQADWLFELFESPNVFVQFGDEFVGIIITNANETFKTNPKGQKLFKFTIQYRKSNSKKSRY